MNVQIAYLSNKFFKINTTNHIRGLKGTISGKYRQNESDYLFLIINIYTNNINLYYFNMLEVFIITCVLIGVVFIVLLVTIFILIINLLIYLKELIFPQETFEDYY